MFQRSKWPALAWAPGLALAAGVLGAGARTASAVPAVGLTASNTLIRFDTSTPNVVSAAVPVTGLQTDETLVGIDVRPATQQLYGIGFAPGVGSDPAVGRIYTINPTSGAATFVATLAADPADLTNPLTAISGFSFGLDFNPVPDRIRLVSDTGQNLRINPVNGLVITDGPLAFAANDPNTGDVPVVTAVAYTNSIAGATATTLYGIDTGNDALVIQNPPNNGTLVTVGPLNQGNPNELASFDIVPGSNEAILLANADGSPTSYVSNINLTTGASTPGRAVGNGTVQLRGLALLPTSTVQLSANAFTVSENAQSVSIPVFRTGDLSGSFSVDFATANGTATSPLDFTSTSGTLLFAPGQRSANIEVPITFSSAAEGSEAFTLTLSNVVSADPSGANVALLGANASATVTITDASVANANGSNATIFALTSGNRLISFASSSPNVITSNVAITGLAAGETLLGIDFRPLNGLLYGVSSANRLYTINTATGAATAGAALVPDPIDATAPFTGLAGTEFGIDFNPAVDRLRIVSDADQNLRINVDTGGVLTDTNLAFDTDTDGGGPDTADVNVGVNPQVVGSGYTSPDNDAATGTVLYGVDAATGTLVVQNPPNNGTLNTIGQLGIDTSTLVGFDIASASTAFAALAPSGSLSSLYAVSLSTGEATLRGQIDFPEAIRGIAVALPGTIQLNTAAVSVSESVASSGAASTVDVTITRSGSGAASVDFTVTSGTATSGSDFTNVSGRINFAPNEQSRTITIPILNDNEAEADETFTVTLSNPENATLTGIVSQTITITNDDAPRVASISNASVNEGNSGTTNATFVVTLSSPSASPVSVNFATADGTATAGTAAGAGDFTSTSGTLTFAPGETSKNISVAVNGDLIAEGPETFVVNLSAPVNTTLGDVVGAARGTGTIVDDDVAALAISLSSGLLAENGTITGTVSRNTSTATALTVNLSSGDVGEATVPASVVIPVGATSATFTISGVDDAQADGSQTVAITASATGLASIQVNVSVSDSGTRPNGVPVGRSDTYRTTGRAIRVNAPGVLANDRDPEGTALRAILLQGPKFGRLSLSPNGAFTYTPTSIFAGADTFVYAASDGVQQSAPVTVTLNFGAARDTTPPTITLEGGALRTLRSLSVVRGSAVDTQVVRGVGSVAASGLRNVSIRFQRGDGQYFNGRTYQRAPFDLPGAFIGRVFFSLSGTLPTTLADGRYRISAIATDNAGNSSTAQQTIFIDTVAPQIVISTPRADANNAASITRLDSVSGRVSGATRVQVAIRRADGFYFNGTGYQSAPSFITAPVVNGQYSVTTGLPSGENLAPGRYILDVRAVDEAGNIGAATRALIVASAPAS